MCELNRKAVQASRDDGFFSAFLRQNEGFILKCASETAHRYVTKSDDEWSVALMAFSQAVREYSADRGGFAGFAKLVIHRRLIDYLRSQSKYRLETASSLSILDSDSQSKEVSKAVFSRSEIASDDSLKLEIECAGQEFAKYGFSFYDLASCSPKARKTKKACARAIAFLVRNPVLIREIKHSRCLPLKILSQSSGVSRKILEHHRKYIIAGMEIMTGDYPFLAEYMRYVREELNK